MELKTELAHFIWHNNLDDFVQPHLEAFERDDWRVMDAEEEYHNGTCVIAEIGPDQEIDDWEDENFSRWLLGGQYKDSDVYGADSDEIPTTRAMLQWLFENDIVLAGKYVIHIYW